MIVSKYKYKYHNSICIWCTINSTQSKNPIEMKMSTVEATKKNRW